MAELNQPYSDLNRSTKQIKFCARAPLRFTHFPPFLTTYHPPTNTAYPTQSPSSRHGPGTHLHRDHRRNSGHQLRQMHRPYLEYHKPGSNSRHHHRYSGRRNHFPRTSSREHPRLLRGSQSNETSTFTADGT